VLAGSQEGLLAGHLSLLSYAGYESLCTNVLRFCICLIKHDVHRAEFYAQYCILFIATGKPLCFHRQLRSALYVKIVR